MTPPLSLPGRPALALVLATVLGAPALAADAAPASPAATCSKCALPDAPAGFEQLADKALVSMKARAEKIGIKGVALVAYAPGDTVNSWTSKMIVVGSVASQPGAKDKGNNFLAIAYSKASEMAETRRDSGSGVRPPKTGEFGWQGGVAARGRTGLLLAAFSGGRSEDDVEVARVGLAILAGAL
jgi:hypothetical protein